MLKKLHSQVLAKCSRIATKALLSASVRAGLELLSAKLHYVCIVPAHACANTLILLASCKLLIKVATV